MKETRGHTRLVLLLLVLTAVGVAAVLLKPWESPLHRRQRGSTLRLSAEQREAARRAAAIWRGAGPGGGAMEGWAESYVKGLYADLESPSPEERASAIFALATPRDTGNAPDVEPAVRALKTDPSSYVRKEAVMALFLFLTEAKLRSVSGTQFLSLYSKLLAASTQDANAEVRADAVGCVDSLLQEFPLESEPAVLEKAISMAKPRLEEALRDPDAQVREQAEAGLRTVEWLQSKRCGGEQPE